jgi:hypothetical protein
MTSIHRAKEAAMSTTMRVAVGAFVILTSLMAGVTVAAAAPCRDIEYGECFAVGVGTSTGGTPGAQVIGVGTFTAEQGSSSPNSIWFEFACTAEAPGAVTTRVDDCQLLTSDRYTRPVSLTALPASREGHLVSTAGEGEGWYCGYWLLAGFPCGYEGRIPQLCWTVSAVFPGSRTAQSSGCAYALR